MLPRQKKKKKNPKTLRHSIRFKYISALRYVILLVVCPPWPPGGSKSRIHIDTWRARWMPNRQLGCFRLCRFQVNHVTGDKRGFPFCVWHRWLIRRIVASKHSRPRTALCSNSRFWRNLFRELSHLIVRVNLKNVHHVSCCVNSSEMCTKFVSHVMFVCRDFVRTTKSISSTLDFSWKWYGFLITIAYHDRCYIWRCLFLLRCGGSVFLEMEKRYFLTYSHRED